MKYALTKLFGPESFSDDPEGLWGLLVYGQGFSNLWILEKAIQLGTYISEVKG